MGIRLLIILLLLLTNNLFGQMFCLNGAEFKLPAKYRLSHLDATVEVVFDVTAYTATNFRIMKVEVSDHIYGFEDKIWAITCGNLRNLKYIRNGKDIKYIVKYEISNPKRVNTSFIEMENVSTIIVRMNTFSCKLPRKIPEPFVEKKSHPDTAIVYISLPFEKGLAPKSDMLVQKFFDGNEEKIVILNNNNPQLEEKILEEASKVDRSRFPDFSKYFYVRFNIKYVVRSCALVTTF